MSGHIKGYVNGIIDGEFSGVIDGEMGAVVRARDSVSAVGPDGQGTPELLPELEAEQVEGDDRNEE